jgi:hypothetical protein
MTQAVRSRDPNGLYTTDFVAHPPVHGIDLKSGEYLLRENLMTKLCRQVDSHDFVHIVSPKGSGKTSLLQLYEQRFGDSVDIYTCDMYSGDESAQDIITECTGIVIEANGDTECPALTGSRKYLLLIIRNMFNKISSRFMETLYRAADRHPLLKVIVSSDADDTESPGPIMQKHLSPADFRAMLNMSAPYGLLDKLKTPGVIDIIVSECDGHASLIRTVTSLLNDRLRGLKVPKLEDVMSALFSKAMTEAVGQCFLDVDDSLTNELNELISSLLTREVQSRTVKERWRTSVGFTSGLDHLIALGLLRSKKRDAVSLSAPLAARFLLKHLFPDRICTAPPTDIRQFVIASISRLSITALQTATHPAAETKEATIQHMMMSAMLSNLPIGYQICPELSTVFAANNAAKASVCSVILGEVDFFLNYKLRWGLELLVHGRGRKEHIDRFQRGGKYYNLKPRDYLVVDFRFESVDIRLDEEARKDLMTVIFEDDHRKCTVLYFTVENGVTVRKEIPIQLRA